MTGEGFSVPFAMDSFVALGCLFGGQASAFLNDRLPESTVMLVAVYFLVGCVVVLRTVFFGGGAH